MDAIELLKQDHDYVDSLFVRIEQTPPSRHPPIFARIKNELDTHAHVEEKIFYPMLMEKGKKKLVEITEEGLEEHAVVKKALSEISRATDKDKREAKLKVLMENVRHHVQEEENEMFAMVRSQFSATQLEKLGADIEAEKARFQKRRGITPRKPEPKGTIEKVMDAVTGLVGGGTAKSDTGAKAKSNGTKTASTNGGASKAKAPGSTAKATGTNGGTAKVKAPAASKTGSAKSSGTGSKAKAPAKSGASKSSSAKKSSARQASK